MYYFQVDQGKEDRTARSLQRQYPDVVFTVPKKKVVGSDRETALLPGIIFADKDDAGLMKTYRMKIVSTQEERRIVRLSDQTPSTAEYDGEHTHFTAGPLVGSDAFVKRVNTKRGSVLLNMKLLGVFWDIWLECTIVEIASAKEQEKRVSATGSSGIRNYQSDFDWEKALAEQKAAKEAAEKAAEQEKQKQDSALGGEQLTMDLDGPTVGAPVEEKPGKRKKPEEFSEEEKKRILARAEVYGIRSAAEEAGISWQTVAWWKRKAPVEEKKFDENATSREAYQRQILERAELVGIHQAAKEAGVRWQTLEWWKKKMAQEEQGAAARAEQGTGEQEAPARRGRKKKEPEVQTITPAEAARRRRVLARAEEVGVRQAAREAGETWQTVSWWRRKADELPEGTAEELAEGQATETTEAKEPLPKENAKELARQNKELRKRVAELEKILRRMQDAARRIAEI